MLWSFRDLDVTLGSLSYYTRDLDVTRKPKSSLLLVVALFINRDMQVLALCTYVSNKIP